jgi:ATP-dependent exoDNAse (exonuclease V), alpha subunit - helicase superfamily I member
MTTPDENNTIFKLASDFVNQTSEHIFLTGKAGTGKTTFLKYIRKNTHKRTLVAAPTGVAAVNAGGVTLHSLFQLPFDPYIPGYSDNSSKKNFFRFSKQKLDLLKQMELLIIDEVSMLRADTLDAIDALLRNIRRNQNPFGGVQMVYIGDVFQLPPVVKDDEWSLLRDYYVGTFFFHAHSIQQTNPVYLELKTVYRQGDPVFIELLNRVRNNETSMEDLGKLNERYNPRFIPGDKDEYIILTTHNYRADNINNKKLAELPMPERKFSGEIKGDFPDYSLPTEKDLCLKQGAQIMFLRNDTEEPRRFYNGKIAKISRIVADQIYVHIPELNEDVLVKKETWENNRYFLDKESGEIKEEELGSFTQFPLRLAWAITIHKSQGLTFDKAVIDTGASFAAGQTYVALSRCTSLEGIVLHSKIRSNSILTDHYALDFSRREREEDDLVKLFRLGKRRFWAERLMLYFDWKPIYPILRELEKLLQEKDGQEYHPFNQLLATIRPKIREFENTTVRFQDQLKSIIQNEAVEEDVSYLKERCQKAVTFFHNQFLSEVLIPLQTLIHSFKKTSKTRTFYKNIILIEEDMIVFLKNRKRVRFNDIALAEDLELKIPKRKELF